MTNLINPQAICETTHIGINSRIQAFTHILPNARIGNDCNIFDHVLIENDVEIGDRVTIKSGAKICDGIRIQDDVFVGPNATFLNDKYPRSTPHAVRDISRTTVEKGASIGGNATILPGLKVGRGALIGAGSVITHDVPPGAIVLGNPGRITGYDGVSDMSVDQLATEGDPQVKKTQVRGVSIYELPTFRDLRGSLTVGEFVSDLPFIPKRFFLVYAVPGKDVRGEHAHRSCEQFLLCISGSIHVLVDDGSIRQEFKLDSPRMGIYLPPMTWSVQYKYSDDAILLAFASHAYSASDYIRLYDEFIELVRGNKT